MGVIVSQVLLSGNGVRCQMSFVRSQVSDVRLHVSDVRLHMPDVRCQMSGYRRQMSGYICQMSAYRCQMSGNSLNKIITYYLILSWYFNKAQSIPYKFLIQETFEKICIS